MRKALFAASALGVLFFASDIAFAEDGNNSFSSLKYNYVVESDLSLPDFSDVFFNRLKSKHNWNEISRNNCQDEMCTSIWKFTDEKSNEWKCEVVIKRDDKVNNRMLVSMEMDPVMGS